MHANDLDNNTLKLRHLQASFVLGLSWLHQIHRKQNY